VLAKAKISGEKRGRLQSQGIAGVQDRHYDGHDCLPEKRKMLMALYSAPEQKKAQVTLLRNQAT
jgi:hypothetical protein